MKMKLCGRCGENLVKLTTEMCGPCRKRHRVSDIEMFRAAEAQSWLSRAWNIDLNSQRRIDNAEGW